MSLNRHNSLAFAAVLLRIAVFFVVVRACTAISDWLFPQLDGLASENVLKLLAWAGFVVSLMVAWWAAKYAGKLLKAEAKA